MFMVVSSRRAVAILAPLFLVACSMTLPVTGRVEGTDETFTGRATGYMDGGGDLELTSNMGARCTGSFVYVTSRQGRGMFNCNDGRTGPFEFVSTGTRGTGTGDFSGRRFTFTFG
jgi:hypothetical protein